MHQSFAPSPGGLDLVRRVLRQEHAVAGLVADTENPDALIRSLLATVTDVLGWSFAAAWLPGAGAAGRADTYDLGCVALWHGDAPELAAFAEATRETALPQHVGLPGRVYASAEPAWIDDVRTDPNFPRADVAVAAGLAAAFCFALTSRDGIEGVVECFTGEVLSPSPELIATAVSLGRRVGDALRRHRVDDEVRRSEARLRAVVDSALDCVIIADATGRVLEFNPAAVETFGWSRDEAIGAALVDLVVPPHLATAHREGLARYLRTDEPRILDRRIETVARRRDGSLLPVELTITRIAVYGLPVFTAYLRDLTERHAAEEELRASRRRVAEAGVVQRQRLERDLHDGAQQRLIGLGLVLARARSQPDAPPRLAALLDDAIAQLDEAAVELRNLARGIHPSSLTKYGLAVAVADVVRRCPVAVEVGPIPDRRFPAAIEATAYFVVSEALTNASRYAPAATVRVDITYAGGELVTLVTDDGPGGADASAGTGLGGLADRVVLLDGAFEVVSPAGGGTALRARLPVPTT